ncbi:hypothetical protein Cfla_2431 [Cellulomonas flavigena DSM 20109]|uniref:Uncharacterized protein n=1 Tax=Cellulomonas flavigena (strain ATCC 482 / DSM 20109 / BCRC 11376 / JCM 18109 / NBRC 3775 / NCIMB 8073 / NRS 134) TaxID=446466 RepID=D5UHK0_CELFN|nr:hypothetical protein Cfla_2431 [Cellulomonas flavigena DSM 20109]
MLSMNAWASPTTATSSSLVPDHNVTLTDPGWTAHASFHDVRRPNP